MAALGGFMAPPGALTTTVGGIFSYTRRLSNKKRSHLNELRFYVLSEQADLHLTLCGDCIQPFSNCHLHVRRNCFGIVTNCTVLPGIGIVSKNEFIAAVIAYSKSPFCIKLEWSSLYQVRHAIEQEVKILVLHKMVFCAGTKTIPLRVC